MEQIKAMRKKTSEQKEEQFSLRNRIGALRSRMDKKVKAAKMEE